MNSTKAPTNLLMIAYYFPPARVVGAIRIYHTYKELALCVNKISVLTTSNQKYIQQDKTLLLPDVKIGYVPTFDIRRWMLKRNQGNPIWVGQGQKKFFTRFILRLLNVFPFNLFASDGSITYVWNGYQMGIEIVRAQEVTHIISSFRPYADHIIGYLLKRKFPGLIWIADFRDLPLAIQGWPGAFYPWKKWEKRLLSQANLITTVSDGLARSFYGLDTPFKVVRNGVDEREVEGVSLSTERFVLQYTGSIYSEKQDPDLLFSSLRSLLDEGKIAEDRILIKYVGPHVDQWNQWIEKYNIPGEAMYPVSRKESLQLQVEAHVNIMLTWAGTFQRGIMTAKLGEYLAARRPIVCLINGELDEEIQTVLTRYNQGIVIHSNPGKNILLCEFLQSAYSNFEQNPRHPFFYCEKDLDAISWSAQMKSLREFITSG